MLPFCLVPNITSNDTVSTLHRSSGATGMPAAEPLTAKHSLKLAQISLVTLSVSCFFGTKSAYKPQKHPRVKRLVLVSPYNGCESNKILILE